MRIKDPELRRRVITNLQEIANGTVARRAVEERAARARRRQQVKEDKARIRAIDRRLKNVREERVGLQEYLDEMLDTEPHWPGALDETEHAIEGCSYEINKLLAEKEVLLSSIREYNP